MFGQNQTRKYEELHCDTCQTQFLSQDELSSHECIDENAQFDAVYDVGEVEGVEAVFSADETEKSAKKTKRSSDSISYSCNTCGEQFTRRRLYQNHIKLAHLPEDAETYRCAECNTDLFVTKHSLELHMEIAHQKDPNCTSFKCPVCAKTFSSKSLLSRHFGIHDNQRVRDWNFTFASF